MPVKGSAQNTDEIAIDDDDDDEMVEAKGPTGKQQMARMGVQEKAIPAGVSLFLSLSLARVLLPLSTLLLVLLFLQALRERPSQVRDSEVHYSPLPPPFLFSLRLALSLPLCVCRYTEGW